MSGAGKNHHRTSHRRFLFGLLVVALVVATNTAHGTDNLDDGGTAATTTTDPTSAADTVPSTTKSCSYLLLAPFSSEKDDEPDANYTEQGSSYAVSALMALEDLKNSTLCNSNNNSNIQFGPLIVRDSQEEDSSVGFDKLVRTVDEWSSPRRDNNTTLCGLVGPFDSKGQGKTIFYTEVKNLPTMFVTGADVDDLAGKDGKTTVANFVSADDYFDLLGEYWKQQLGLTHVVFLGTGSKKMRLFSKSFAKQMERHGLQHNEFAFKNDQKHDTVEGIRKDLQQIKDTGFRNVFLVTDYRDPKSLVTVANEMDQVGMLDGNYQYFLYEENVRPREIDYLFGSDLETGGPESPIAKLLHGAGFFTEIDPFEVSIYHHNLDSPATGTNTAADVDDSFVKRWRAFDPRRIDYPKTATPLTSQDLQRLLPMRHSTYVYDSIMAMGLAECYASSTSNDKDKDSDNNKNKENGGDTNSNKNRKLQEGGAGSSATDKGGKGGGDKNDKGGNESGGGGKKKKPKKPKPIKNKVIRAMIDMPPFQGESGMVDFEYDGELRYRSLIGMQFAMFNFRVVMGEHDHLRAHAPMTALLHFRAAAEEDEEDPDTNDAKIRISNKQSPHHHEWEFLEDFIFSASTKQPPNPQFVVADENFLSDGIFALGMTLFAVGCFLAIGCFVAISKLQGDVAVRVAQPLFLKLICFGSLVELLAILMQSFDEHRGWSQGALDFGCMASMWFFFIGHAVIYTAIFCKLWRIDQVMTARRRVVKEWQVLWPAAVLLLAIIVLLVCWTVIDPWKWKREFISLTPPVRMGTCQSDNFAAFFVPLSSILVLCTFITACFVWKTKSLGQDLSDTSTVFYLILTQLQAWFVGLPILVVIDDDSVDSVYLGRILLVWLFAIAPLIIVLLPRISQAMHNNRNPNPRPNRHKVHITGLAASIRRSAGFFMGTTRTSTQPSSASGSSTGTPKHRYTQPSRNVNGSIRNSGNLHGITRGTSNRAMMIEPLEGITEESVTRVDDEVELQRSAGEDSEEPDGTVGGTTRRTEETGVVEKDESDGLDEPTTEGVV